MKESSLDAGQAGPPSVEGIRALADLCQRAGVEDLDASTGTWSVRLHLDSTAVAVHNVPALPLVEESVGPLIVYSAWVGQFHRAADGETTPLAREGQIVREGDVVGLIAAMQVQHEVRSEGNGTLLRFLVEEGSAIEYGQPLLEIG